MSLVVRADRGFRATYGESNIEITLTCDCHPPFWGGRGERTGLRSDPADPSIDRPVYRLRPTEHQEFRDTFVMLLPDGNLEPISTNAPRQLYLAFHFTGGVPHLLTTRDATRALCKRHYGPVSAFNGWQSIESYEPTQVQKICPKCLALLGDEAEQSLP